MKNKLKPFSLALKLPLFVFTGVLTANGNPYLAKKSLRIEESARIETKLQQREITITGNVFDDQGPLAGVFVKAEGTGNTSITDVNGNFTIKALANGKLTVSYIGYVPQTLDINNRTSIKVQLAVESKNLNEVVVVGYGTQKKVNLTGAVSVVGGEELITRQSPNTTSLLQGRMSGVQVVQNTGQPGAEKANIQIRGQGTFSGVGNDPLILIDGVEGSLNSVNPNMIESISVLKDAASASIYGSRAAAGVILVTTKNGRAGRLNVDYTLNLSNQKATSIYKGITYSPEYMELLNKAIDHTGLNVDQKYTQAEIDLYRNGDPELYPSYNWMDAVFRTAPMQQHYLSVNGGQEKTTYNFGLGYLNQDGILINTNYKKYDAQFNLNSNLSNKVTFGTNIAFSQGARHESALNGNFDGNPTEDQILSALAAHPTFKPTLPDGSGRFTSKAFLKEGGNKNPVAIANNGGRDLQQYYALASANLKVDILPDLIGEVRGGVKFNNGQTGVHVIGVPTYLYIFDPNPTVNDFPRNGQINGTVGENNMTIRDERDIQYTLYGTLKYQKTFAETHNFDIMLGANQENFKYNRMQGFKRNAPVSDLKELAGYSPTGQTVTGYAWEWALQSVFGRLNYNYKEKYLLEANFRYDGSSRFIGKNKWGFFPSASVGWRVNQEDFLKDVEWVNNLKLRGSWGQLGNQNVNRTITLESQPYPYQAVFTPGNYYIDGVLQQGLRVGDLNNENIKWETTTITDIGVDFDLLGNKLFGTIDWYRKYATDILRSLQVPSYIGLNGPTVNDGEMKNTGLEFLLGYQDRSREFKYSVSMNFETYKNTVVKFGTRQVNSGSGLLTEEGLPYNSYYMYMFDGIYQNSDDIANSPKTPNWVPKPGDMKYKDISGPNGTPDGIINEYDRAVVGGAFPKFNYGFTFSAEYKRFDLSAFLQGIEGKKIYIKEWGIAPFRQGSVPSTYWRGAWDGEGTSNTIPHIFNENYTPNTQVSDWWLQDASYLRLKNIQLGYSFAPELTKKVGITKLRAYLSGDNLVTFTKFFDGIDPERSAANSRGAIYPQAKLYSFGLKATF
ncbi:TonB-dependent receptor plug [Pseudopedobacter saltans DSM 12145]|uniref:TonB-dependent receptor plug n=1 Tax=Pseudopedobacter saltans (strain ATCC 51119 / DSM 12145 / JCM 21818 / CCUG 39354 / LMG 10337 / NBRC 100064 / NCIMB 13643) TaxID=762903 RepID=F0S4W8_PSESL|nr:TonB-dependent receptor [Pseudopedobacter saltans]ADY54142.1 TonB-dependent receptor plug [Pseudopedobacter saltans DSM 12145]